jgi:hypothetical protein
VQNQIFGQAQAQPMQPMSAFYRTPASLAKPARGYPPNQDDATRAARMELRDTVTDVATEIVGLHLGPMNIRGLYEDICDHYNGVGQRRGSVIGFNEWANRLKDLAAFMPMAVHNDAAGAAVESGERMTVDLMNAQPTVEDFLNDPATVLVMLVVRALHRHVNHSVFATFDLRSTPTVGNTNPNTVRVPVVNGNRFDKGVMSRQFLHNSQRAYWSRTVSEWALEHALPAARCLIIVALSELIYQDP